MKLDSFVLKKDTPVGPVRRLVRQPTTVKAACEAINDVIFPLLEQMQHNEAVAQAKILKLEHQVEELQKFHL